jgi:hypothetical protein
MRKAYFNDKVCAYGNERSSYSCSRLATYRPSIPRLYEHFCAWSGLVICKCFATVSSKIHIALLRAQEHGIFKEDPTRKMANPAQDPDMMMDMVCAYRERSAPVGWAGARPWGRNDLSVCGCHEFHRGGHLPTTQVKGNMSMILPQILLMTWVNQFFYGFLTSVSCAPLRWTRPASASGHSSSVHGLWWDPAWLLCCNWRYVDAVRYRSFTAQVPFPLTLNFKEMTQRGVELSVCCCADISVHHAAVHACPWARLATCVFTICLLTRLPNGSHRVSTQRGSARCPGTSSLCTASAALRS